MTSPKAMNEMAERQYTNEEHMVKALERIANSLEKHTIQKFKFQSSIAAGIVIGVFFMLVFRAAGVLP